MCTLQQYAALPGRIALCIIFLFSGFGKIGNFAGTTEYMAQHGMPWTTFFLAGAIVLELAGGLSLLLGFKARWGVLALIVFLIPATLIFHAFWAVEPDMVRTQMINFLKNVAILGGLLTVFAHGSGPLSLDQLLRAKKGA